MSEPIIEQIAQSLLAKCATVRVSNGCTFNLAAVRPTAGMKFAAIDGAGLLFQADPQPTEGAPQGYERYIVPFAVQVCVVLADTNTTAIETVMNRRASDVWKIIAADPTCGGLAEEMMPQGFEGCTLANSDRGGVQVNFTVQYSTLYGDPFSQ